MELVAVITHGVSGVVAPAASRNLTSMRGVQMQACRN
jgi:hypothetical protein